MFDDLAPVGRFGLGRELELFEGEFAQYRGVAHGVGVATGPPRSSSRCVRGVGPGSEVVTVAHTLVATVEGVAATGARSVLVDVDPATRCMDPAALRQALGSRTAAVVVVHSTGGPPR